MDLSHILVSSQTEEETIPRMTLFQHQNKAPANRQNRQGTNVSVVVVTSTLTSFTLKYSSYPRVVTNLAATTALSCLPYGFTLC